MGDRGNIAVVQSDGQVWFYTHWSGSEVKQRAQQAVIRGKSRWSDKSYFTRCVADEFIPKLKKGEEPTGYGISTRICDNEHPIMVLDCNREIAFLIEESALDDGRVPKDYKPSESWTFEQFQTVKLKELQED
jgi:hypothetical protein